MKKTILSILFLIVCCETHSQVLRYELKNNELIFEKHNVYDSTRMFSTGIENAGIKIRVVDMNGEEIEIFSSFGASQFDFISEEEASLFNVYVFYADNLGSNSEIVCIEDDERPCRPEKKDADLIFYFKIAEGTISGRYVFNKDIKRKVLLMKELPNLHKVLGNPFPYCDF